MDASLSRQQLIDLVGRLLRAEGSETQQNEWLGLFERSVPHPNASDLIYYPEVELTAEEIVDVALGYKPVILPADERERQE
jgi:hypothetical protein